MNASQILHSLERERQLLRESRGLSEQQLTLMDVADIEGVNHLLDQRAAVGWDQRHGGAE